MRGALVLAVVAVVVVLVTLIVARMLIGVAGPSGVNRASSPGPPIGVAGPSGVNRNRHVHYKAKNYAHYAQMPRGKRPVGLYQNIFYDPNLNVYYYL